MLDTTKANTVARQINQKAKQMVSEAMLQATSADSFLTQLGESDVLHQKLENARQNIQTTVTEVEATIVRITKERQPAVEKLEEIDRMVLQAQAESDQLANQIKAKEDEIAQLITVEADTAIGPFGSFRMPDAASLARAGVLQAEVAGLYTVLGSAKLSLANVLQSKIALSEKIVLTPLEADPRMTALFTKLEMQNKALTDLNQKVLEVVEDTFEAIFTENNKRDIASKLSKHINTGLPDSIEADLFRDAVGEAEKTLVKSIPPKALALIGDEQQGFDDASGRFVDTLTERVNKEVDIPTMSEEQEAIFFEMLINLLIDAMKKGNDLDKAIAEMV